MTTHLRSTFRVSFASGWEPCWFCLPAPRPRYPHGLFTCSPMWLGGGPMWEPMAIAIIFGLLFTRLLTLGVVPVLYTLFFRVRFERGEGS